MARFSDVSESDVANLIAKSKNQNTTKATVNWMNVFKDWAESQSKSIEIEKYDPVELNTLLEFFFAGIKKKNGKEYEPSSLCNMQSAIDRYLKEKGYQESILKSRVFESSRAVLEGKARLLREKGMGKKPNKAESLTSEEEETLWECGQFGSHSPKAIINTLWWTITQHFRMLVTFLIPWS